MIFTGLLLLTTILAGMTIGGIIERDISQKKIDCIVYKIVNYEKIISNTKMSSDEKIKELEFMKENIPF